jgi:hypothetical protein
MSCQKIAAAYPQTDGNSKLLRLIRDHNKDVETPQLGVENDVLGLYRSVVPIKGASPSLSLFLNAPSSRPQFRRPLPSHQSLAPQVVINVVSKIQMISSQLEHREAIHRLVFY